MVATASSATTEMNSVQFSATSDHHGVNTSVGVVANVGVALGSDGNRSESPPTSEEPEYPMDLSSAAGHAALPIFTSATPPFMCAAPPTSTMVESILNARRLAEFVRAQQLQMKEEEHEDTPSKPIVPRKRAWPELQLDLSAMVSEKLKKSENFGHPSSPTESNSSSSGGTATPTSNKEVKKRRLDELLSKKFAVDVPSVESGDKPEMDNNLAARPPFSIKPAKNRRKKSITLSLRPNSELLAEKESEKNSAEKSEDEENEEKNSADFNLTLKNQQQLLQLHLAQAALMNQTAAGSNLFPGFFPSAVSGNGNNPLLYYGYYAQMIQGLQSQQQKLLQQLTSSGKKIKTETEMKMTPFHTPKSAASSSFSPSPRLLPNTPNSPPSPKYEKYESAASPHNLLSSPLSGSDEPRRRAPRALTGRYVKSGPGASPRTLAILRKKIEERLKLKELLGDNFYHLGAKAKTKANSKPVSRF